MKKSSITLLDPRVRDAVDAAIREGRATTDELVLLIKSHGQKASRSAVGRYMKNATDQMRTYREAQEVAKVWIGKINDEPEGDMGRLVAEMLRTVAYQTVGAMNDEKNPKSNAKPMDVMLLAKALDHLSASESKSTARLVIIRTKLGAKLDKIEAELKGKKQATDPLELVRQIREGAYGLFDKQ